MSYEHLSKCITVLQVSNVLNQHKAELMEKRYRCNIGLLMCKLAVVACCLIFSDSKLYGITKIHGTPNLLYYFKIIIVCVITVVILLHKISALCPSV